MQLDLLAPPGLDVKPSSTAPHPRLWLQRLVLWEDPWKELRPPITFRPGMNIIWSPDVADRGRRRARRKAAGPGHGAGKSLICRLLRYCLGEPSFAPEPQRTKIARAFREGRVGAEVVLDGVVWAVIRSIGVLPFDVVRENATLATTIAGNPSATGIAPLANALARQLLTEEVSELLSTSPERAWLATLEWLARDQECRFGKVIEWRDASSDSGSPRLSGGGATNVVRALLGAITPREYKLEQEVKELERVREAAKGEADQNKWGISRLVRRIARALELDTGNLPEDGLLVGRLKQAASEALARTAYVDAKSEHTSLENLEAEYEEARSRLEQIKVDLASATHDHAMANALAKRIEAETPGLSADIDDAENPPCPICCVPIDRAIAEGCKLSYKLVDVRSLRNRREQNARELTSQREKIAFTSSKIDALKDELTEANALVTSAWQRVTAARQLRKERTDAWYAAQRVSDDIADLEQLLLAKDTTESDIANTDARIKDTREAIAIERDQHASTFTHLERHFDALVREILGAAARGFIQHDGNGLHLRVELGGERSTPAIDSVKILAFDLAAMCRSMEGATHLPALFIHDSPREADLGLSHYHQLFRLMRRLESISVAPPFQYIVTTTTHPPDDLAVEPWLRLELSGAPADNRLLRRDL